MGVWRPLKCDSLRGKRSKGGPKSVEIPHPPGVGGKTNVRVYSDTQETPLFSPDFDSKGGGFLAGFAVSASVIGSSTGESSVIDRSSAKVIGHRPVIRQSSNGHRFESSGHRFESSGHRFESSSHRIESSSHRQYLVSGKLSIFFHENVHFSVLINCSFSMTIWFGP